MNLLGIPRTALAVDPPLSIASLLEQGVASAPGQDIVYAGGARYTYLALAERVARLASALASLGVRPGSTVAVMDWDSHRYLEAFFAVPMMGAVLHTVNVRMSPEQVAYTLNHAADEVILVNREFLPLLEAIRGKLPPAARWVLVDDAGGAVEGPVAFAAEYESMLAGASAEYDFPALEEDTRATTFYTTGTTGDPKGVYYSHRQLVLHALAAAHALANAPHATFGAGDVYMPITPMFHVHAWGLPYVATMLGVKQVYPGRYDPDALLRLIDSEGVTFSHCVPTILKMLLDRCEVAGAGLGGWKVFIGGSALPLALAQAAVERGIDVIAGYGMSETGPILTLAHLRPHMLRRALDKRLPYRCRAGRPIPFVQLRVVDEQMRDVPRDGSTPGEVVVRAPWLTQGYLHDPGRSADLWRGGWLHTGDVGLLDAEGYLKITDRIKDVVKSGGEWVSSLDIEDLILRLPGIAEAAVVGLPDARWGERPVALVVAKAGAAPKPTERDVREHLARFAESGTISRYAVPDRVQFVEAIPKTSVGKLDKKAIRASLMRESAPA